MSREAQSWEARLAGQPLKINGKSFRWGTVVPQSVVDALGEKQFAQLTRYGYLQKADPKKAVPVERKKSADWQDVHGSWMARHVGKGKWRAIRGDEKSDELFDSKDDAAAAAELMNEDGTDEQTTVGDE